MTVKKKEQSALLSQSDVDSPSKPELTSLSSLVCSLSPNDLGPGCPCQSAVLASLGALDTGLAGLAAPL